MKNDIVAALNNMGEAVLVILNLSSAFDTVNDDQAFVVEGQMQKNAKRESAYVHMRACVDARAGAHVHGNVRVCSCIHLYARNTYRCMSI